MKLLILTQKIDKHDPVLGFFHRWVEVFSEQYERVSVVCLEKGEYSLPSNVAVFSLGKEDKRALLQRFFYVWRFYLCIWKLRKEYDSVFVHMNQEYMLLGGLFWRLWGKKVVLWYNHIKGSVLTRISAFLSHTVLHTSPFAYSATFNNSCQMSAGIDTDLFQKDSRAHREKNSILSLGRISPVKNVDVFIDALEILHKKKTDFVAHIYGDPTDSDKKYYKQIRDNGKNLEQVGKIIFHKGVSYDELPKIYNTYEVFVNLTNSGSFDKTIFEAMACENIVTASNESLKDILEPPLLFKERDSESLADSLEYILSMPDREKIFKGRVLRDFVIKNHSLSALAKDIVTVFEKI